MGLNSQEEPWEQHWSTRPERMDKCGQRVWPQDPAWLRPACLTPELAHAPAAAAGQREAIPGPWWAGRGDVASVALLALVCGRPGRADSSGAESREDGAQLFVEPWGISLCYCEAEGWKERVTHSAILAC